jgi:hypothetical protein
MTGRAILLNSVLNAPPLYHMQAFLLPQGVIGELTKIKRQFFWRGHDSFSGGALPSLIVDSKSVTMPKEYGGLGILNLRA